MQSASSKPPIAIDGSHGEGGGQILRSALALASLTGQSFSMTQIRQGRKVPGLRPQHRMAVLATGQMTGAKTSHAEVGSSEILFTPGTRPQGDFSFQIGTAGATSLLLHALIYPLASSEGPSSLSLQGGTHVEQAPTFHYLQDIWLPSLQAAGWPLHLEIDALGCYPKGGGQIRAWSERKAQPTGITWLEAEPPEELVILAVVGDPRAKSATSWEGESPPPPLRSDRFAQIASRMTHAAASDLADQTPKIRRRHLHAPSLSVGVTCHIFCLSPQRKGGFTAWGEKGRTAEEVGRQAAALIRPWLQSPASVDEWLADQLLLPLALADRPSVFIAPEATGHLETNIHTIQRFLPDCKILLSPHQTALRVEITPSPDAAGFG